MSATFKLAKKKYTQHDLRKLMHQQMIAGTAESSGSGASSIKKIDSPLAKYNELGQLMCILCKSIVRSEDVWKIHINAKQHKQNIEIAKQLKEKTQNFTIPLKRPTSSAEQSTLPEKKLKGIIKNVQPLSSAASTLTHTTINSNTRNIPSDFFDEQHNKDTENFYEATLKKTSIRNDLLNIQRNPKSDGNNVQSQIDNNGVELMDTTTISTTDEKLPEGFFDDPKKDAKARNSEYKDPIEEEWEKFQKEMKEAANFSNAIIAVDQEESTTERQIDEIDEQMRNWSRVLNLERKKQDVVAKEKEIIYSSNKIIDDDINMNVDNNKNNFDHKTGDDDDNDDDADSDDFNEFLDWRSKQSHK